MSEFRIAGRVEWYDNEWGYANRLVDMIGQIIYFKVILRYI